jgi:hypothetical protein
VAVFAATTPDLAPDAVALRRALRSPGAAQGFRDIPVDWYDRRASSWRPTAVAAQVSPGGAVDVFVPIDEGLAVAPARVDSLRLARGQSDAVMRFWTVRYHLRLVRLLGRRASGAAALAIDAAARELAASEAELRDVWLTAYAHGVPPRAVRTLYRPSDVQLRTDGARDASPAPPATAASSQEGVLLMALTLYAQELTRIRRALRAAGMGTQALDRHPLCVVLAQLSAAAVRELDRAHAAGAPTLDPAVWGT